jgi:hypothetical protein
MRAVVPTLLVLAATAHANPRPLPMTYTTDTLPAKAAELELYLDMTPLRAISPASSEAETFLASAFAAEFEIGLTDRLELGLYLTFVPDFGEQYANQTRIAGAGTGAKQRLRYRFADEGAWPVDVGIYGELVENEREIEIETKLLLHRRFDRLRIAANLSSEYELYFSKQREWVLNPSLGASYEITPAYHVGLEAWVRGEYPTNPKPASRTFGLGPHAYVGPTLMMSFGTLWWTVGAYARVTETAHDLQPGEPYGRVWVRSLIGFDL